jgi:DNA-binding MarR family transcriptional regulator
MSCERDESVLRVRLTWKWGPSSLMAIRAINWAYSLKLDPTAKALLVALADHADEKKGMTCWPSLRRLTQRTCLSKNAVTKGLTRLEKAGLITRTHQFYNHHGCRSTLYTLLVPAGDHPLSPTKTPLVTQGDSPCPSKFLRGVSGGDTEPLIRTDMESLSNPGSDRDGCRSGLYVQPENLTEYWERVKASLRETMDKHRYDTWVDPASLFSIQRLSNGRACWSFRVPNEHFRKWWQEHDDYILDAAERAGIAEDIFCQFAEMQIQR